MDTKERGNRKARIGKNHCTEHDGGKEWAVFMHTFYGGRWYYDGYTAHHTQEAAEAERQRWLDEAR